MKVAIINKSDSTGGAAVVSFRLMEALHRKGVDARMIVAEKLTDSPYVTLAGSKREIMMPFLAERLKIFIKNGFDRKTLFKIDTASDGIDLSRDPFVKEADVICLAWVNQGLLSLKDVEKLSALGKPIVWVMHDMWCFTGLCHHAGACVRYEGKCGKCPLLGEKRERDLSTKTQLRKKTAYLAAKGKLHFVAVSRWLADCAARSGLLGDMPLSVIPNAFPITRDDANHTLEYFRERRRNAGGKCTMVFGAARLDDPIKGFPILIEAMKALKEMSVGSGRNFELVTFGAIQDESLLDAIAVPHRHLGRVKGRDAVWNIYRNADIVVSTSLYETLPGTLIEGQANGCIPVSFVRGGQRDIIDHLSTGYLAEWNDDPAIAGRAIAEGIMRMSAEGEEMRVRMAESVIERFSADSVARRFISLFKKMLS